MSIITFEQKGDFSKTDKFLEKILNIAKLGTLDKYGKMGVDALSAATPIETGLAASSWTYEIERTKSGTNIVWSNSDIEGGCSVVLLLQYGHATRGGTYVKGVDFINPAMRPVFDQIAEESWREVTE